MGADAEHGVTRSRLGSAWRSRLDREARSSPSGRSSKTSTPSTRAPRRAPPAELDQPLDRLGDRPRTPPRRCRPDGSAPSPRRPPRARRAADGVAEEHALHPPAARSLAAAARHAARRRSGRARPGATSVIDHWRRPRRAAVRGPGRSSRTRAGRASRRGAASRGCRRRRDRRRPSRRTRSRARPRRGRRPRRRSRAPTRAGRSASG